jgi:hypothetical protein
MRSNQLRRRDFIAFLGGAALSPLRAQAQQPPAELPRICSIHTARNENFESYVRGLREAGYLDGRNARRSPSSYYACEGERWRIPVALLPFAFAGGTGLPLRPVPPFFRRVEAASLLRYRTSSASTEVKPKVGKEADDACHRV